MDHLPLLNAFFLFFFTFSDFFVWTSELPPIRNVSLVSFDSLF